jgi:Exostosin family
MRVLIHSAYGEPSPNYLLQWLIERGSPAPHQLVTDPAAADLIIFGETFSSLDPYFLDVLRHPLFRAFPEKCVLHHNGDSVVTFCRTVSPSVELQQPNQDCRRSFHYIARRRDIEILSGVELNEEARYLFSFWGATGTHPMRKRLMALHHSEASLAEVRGDVADVMPKRERDQFHLEYCRSILQSQFVLCPRGLGPTSMRLFEVMQLGRVPVVIGDTWKRIGSVPWEECAIFVREADIEGIPQLLRERRAEAEFMGKRARVIWEEFFAPERSLVRLIEECAATLGAHYGSTNLLKDLAQVAPMGHWRGLSASLVRIGRFGKASVIVRGGDPGLKSLRHG